MKPSFFTLSMGPRLRGDDGVEVTLRHMLRARILSMGPRLRGDDGFKISLQRVLLADMLSMPRTQ
ncbi:hypothetical protein GCM10027318_14050 [Massilia agilis]